MKAPVKGANISLASGSLTAASILSVPHIIGKDTPQAKSLQDFVDHFVKMHENEVALTVREDVRSQNNRPYYADTQRGVYGLIVDSEEDTLNTPYNVAVGLSSQDVNAVYAPFKADTKSESDIALESYISGIILRVKEKDLKENFFYDQSEHGKIGRLCLQTLASEYWTKVIGFDPLVPSQSLEIPRMKDESMRQYKSRRSVFLKKPIKRYSKILIEALSGAFTHKDREAEARALVHILRCEFKRHEDYSWFNSEILSNPQLIPSIVQLKRLGKVPDIQIQAFQNLFHTTEWREIMESSVYKLETRLKELLRTKITGPQQLISLLKEFSKYRQQIGEDLVSKKALELKKKRLGFCSGWKQTLPRDRSLIPLDYAVSQIQEPKIKDAFGPFEIICAAGHPGSETAHLRIQYSRELRSYQWGEPEEGQISSPAVDAAGLEFCAYMNRSIH